MRVLPVLALASALFRAAAKPGRHVNVPGDAGTGCRAVPRSPASPSLGESRGRRHGYGHRGGYYGRPSYGYARPHYGYGGGTGYARPLRLPPLVAARGAAGPARPQPQVLNSGIAEIGGAARSAAMSGTGRARLGIAGHRRLDRRRHRQHQRIAAARPDDLQAEGHPGPVDARAAG